MEALNSALKRCLVLLTTCLVAATCMAQDRENEECARNLKKANNLYEQGLIEKVEPMLTKCIENGFSKEERLEAYKLIILSKLYDDKDAEARELMLEFLRMEPEYEINPATDPKEFSALFAEYHTSPLFTVGFTVGLNGSVVNSYVEHGVYNTELDEKSFQTDGVSLQFGVNGNRYLFPGGEITLEALWVQNRFQYQIDLLSGSSRIEVFETQTRVDIPLSMTYTFMRHKKLRPYIRAGAGIGILMTAESEQTRSYLIDAPLTSNISGPNFNLKENNQRTDMTYWALAGVGGRYKVPRGMLVFELRYMHGLSNQVNEDDRYGRDNWERLYDYYITDNDFTLNNLSFSIGYNRFLYKARAKKN